MWNPHYVVQGGATLGTVLAVVLSWSKNQSILLAIGHGILSWLYVIYIAATRTDKKI